MNRAVRFASLLLSAIATPAVAGDYVVQVDSTGYVDQPANGPAPAEILLGRIEAVARPGTPFFARTTLGKETLLLQGELTETEDGKFFVEIHWQRTIDDGVEVPVGDGRRQKVLDQSTTKTGLKMDLEQPVLMGYMATERTSGDPAAIPVRSLDRRTVRIVRFPPLDD